MNFLFSAALWALPLAAVPILLHLLLKQKTPIVPFSTLRFIRASVQQTAARRKLRQWLLLASRVLLIALLIWAVAQPARTSVAGWLGGGRSVVAAIVVDTSYSMLDEDGGATRLSKADGVVQQLLRGDLARAKVAVFRSRTSPGQPEQLQSAAGVLTEWSPLQPQPAEHPLADRVAAAVAMLNRQPADDKWLFVISDFQSREFPHPLAAPDAGRVVLIDLHPDKPRSAGIAAITVHPDRLIPGVGAEAVVRVVGPPGEPRAVTLGQSDPSNPAEPKLTPPLMATPDSTGRAEVHFPFTAGANHRTLLTAAFTAADAMPWDDHRSIVVESPRRQNVSVIGDGQSMRAERFIRLALDPSEGSNSSWPVRVDPSNTLTGRPDAVVLPLSRWPAAAMADRLTKLATSGRTVVLLLSPELAGTWSSLAAADKQAMLALLPSPPQATRTLPSHATLADSADPLFEGLRDQSINFDAVTVRKAVPLTAAGDASELLGLAPLDPADVESTANFGLCFRKPIGSGLCYTLATMPDGQSTNLATQPLFLPLMVRMVLPTAARSTVYNGEIGKPIVFDGALAPNVAALEVDGPDGTRYQVPAVASEDGLRQFVFEHTDAPGTYTFHAAGAADAVAVANVSLPADESDLTYREAKTVAPTGVPLLIARSIDELHAHVAAVSQPQPQWSLPVAIVMLLLCAEAALGTLPAWNARSKVG